MKLFVIALSGGKNNTNESRFHCLKAVTPWNIKASSPALAISLSH